LAVLGVPRAAKKVLAVGVKPHVVTSTIEHHAVLEPLIHLEKTGEIELTQLPVDGFGQVSVKDLEASLKSNTVLVTVMMANNEIGTIQPIADLGRALLAWRKVQGTMFPYFHFLQMSHYRKSLSQHWFDQLTVLLRSH
jgi:cysteine sulfinate desulfinase/cysteine desulfurase-like protein